MVSEIGLLYPVIALPKNQIAFFARNESDLVTCSSVSLRNGFYEGMTLIDSEGKVYEIISAEKIKGKGFFWGYNIFLNQKILVKLNYSHHVTTITLEELKESVIKNFKKDVFFWNADGELSSRIRNVNIGQNHKTILESLTNYFYKGYA